MPASPPALSATASSFYSRGARPPSPSAWAATRPTALVVSDLGGSPDQIRVANLGALRLTPGSKVRIGTEWVDSGYSSGVPTVMPPTRTRSCPSADAARCAARSRPPSPAACPCSGGRCTAWRAPSALTTVLGGRRLPPAAGAHPPVGARSDFRQRMRSLAAAATALLEAGADRSLEHAHGERPGWPMRAGTSDHPRSASCSLEPPARLRRFC